MSGPSLTRQGEHVLESLPAIGRSRHAAKRANVSAEAIHSWGTSRTYLGRCYPFVHWAQDAYDLRRLTGLEPEMIAGYVGALRAGERAGGYVRGAPSAVGKLQAGINRRWRAGLEPIPEDLWAAGSEPRFGYGLDDARRIIAHVGGRDPLAALVLRGQLATGLRQAEALHLRWDTIRKAGACGRWCRARTYSLGSPTCGHGWWFLSCQAQIRHTSGRIARAAPALRRGPAARVSVFPHACRGWTSPRRRSRAEA